MGPSFQIEAGTYILLAIGLLILPLDWLLGAILAAVFHELCHYLAVTCLGIKCLRIRIGTGGILMELGPMSRWQELIIALAGPAGSLMLFLFLHIYPQLAICAGVQGLFNLLPIWPLDGGRILHSVLYNQESACRLVEQGTGVLILCTGIYLCISLKQGICPFFLAGFITAKAFLRKIPCKDAVLGVQ